MTQNQFENLLQEKTAQVNKRIEAFLPKECGYQKTVLAAMNYSVIGNGKRLRPIFMMEAYTLFGGANALVEPFMAAIEMIHGYSLVHDDLPDMDCDEYRRGRLTTWKKFSPAMGILAGDGLLNYAYETALRAFQMAASLEEYQQVADALTILAKKAGVYGMVGGQCLDVEAEKANIALSREELEWVHEYKTAALIQASLMIGAILAGADKEMVDLLEKCGYYIGLAFQIQDDILDVTGDSRILGKSVGSDAKNEKQTYVTLYGLEESQKQVKELSDAAISIVRSLPGDSTFLEMLISNLIYRNK